MENRVENLLKSLVEKLQEGERALVVGEMQLAEAQRYNGQIGLSTIEYEQLLELWHTISTEIPTLNHVVLPLIARAEVLLHNIEDLNRMPVEESIRVEIELRKLPGHEAPETLIEGLIRTLIEDNETRQIIQKTLREFRQRKAIFPDSIAKNKT